MKPGCPRPAGIDGARRGARRSRAGSSTMAEPASPTASVRLTRRPDRVP